MINKIRIQNFKCLQDVEVELEPFTVLIGPNDSGKTSFLEAISWLSRLSQRNAFIDYQELQSLVWEKKKGISCGWRVSGEISEPFEYRLQIPNQMGDWNEFLRLGPRTLFEIIDGVGNSQGHGVSVASKVNQTLVSSLASRDDAVSIISRYFEATQEYHLNPQAMREPSPAEESPLLHPSGDNLASVVLSLLAGPDRQTIADLEEKLHEEIDSIKGISTPLAPGKKGLHVLEYTLSAPAKPPITIPASQVSDGAILLTAFLALAYGNTPQILLIEEPENGLHPSRLKKVIEILRQMTTGEIGNQPRQIIITTHSPLLLNFVKPKEIRIFKRDENGATQATAMDKVPNIERLQKEFAPGELWYLFGEEDLVKGQPA